MVFSKLTVQDYIKLTQQPGNTAIWLENFQGQDHRFDLYQTPCVKFYNELLLSRITMQESIYQCYIIIEFNQL